jgi:hypothetical protein
MTNATSNWKSLYRIGGVAPLLTLAFYISEYAFIDWETFPASTEAWFLLFQRSKLLGLFYLNFLDIISIMLLGVMFLALYAALRDIDPSSMSVAAFFSLLGVIAFVVPRIAMLSLMTLSDQYAIATTEVERMHLLAAGEALGSLGTPTPQTVGFFFMSIGVLIISIVMLQGKAFTKVAAWFGILASLLTFTDDISIVLAPTPSTPLMIASGLFWIPWWVMIGIGLLRLAGRQSSAIREL